MLDHQADRAGDRLELQRDIGHRADRGDQRRDQRDVKALAVARAEEVGDRGDLLGLGQPDDAPEQRKAEQEHQHRADIDRQEFRPALGGEADRAEEGPRRAVDGEAERIDIGPRLAAAARRRAAVADAGDREQQRHIGDRGEDDGEALQELLLPRAVRAKAITALAASPFAERIGATAGFRCNLRVAPRSTA